MFIGKVGVWDEFPDYCFSIFGAIYSCLSGELVKLKPCLTGSGHLKVDMKDRDGKWRAIKVHRAIATVFHPNSESLPIVEHADHDKLNNHRDNLFWSTQKNNMNAVIAEGKRQNKTPVQLFKDGKLVGNYPSIKKCAKENKMNYYKVYRWAKGYYKGPKGYELKIEKKSKNSLAKNVLTQNIKGMDTKKPKGQFFETLDRSGKEIKKGRAQAIGEDAKLTYGRTLEDKAMEIRRLQTEREAALDLSPKDINSLVMAQNFDGPAFVARDLQNSIDIRNLKIQLDVGMERYTTLFGEEFKLNFQID